TLLCVSALLTPVPRAPPDLPPFPTRRSSDLGSGVSTDAQLGTERFTGLAHEHFVVDRGTAGVPWAAGAPSPPGRAPERMPGRTRSEEHTSELQSRENLVCRLLLEKKKRGVARPCLLSGQAGHRQVLLRLHSARSRAAASNRGQHTS